jgi:hypothetical protein
MNPGLNCQRVEWLKEPNFPGARVVSVDATEPLDGVKRIARRAIWDMLLKGADSQRDY